MVYFRRRYSRRVNSPIGIAISGGLIGIILIGVGVFSMFRGSELETLDKTGVRVEGHVVESEKDTRRETYYRDGRRRTRTKTDYFVTCRFQHEGRQVNKRIKVSSGAYGRYSRASHARPVPATYVVNPSDTSDWMLQEDLKSKKRSSGLMAWLMPLFGLLVLAGTAVGAFFAYKRRHRDGGQIPHGAPPPGQHPQKYPAQPGHAPPPPNQQDNVLYDADRPEHKPPPRQ